MNAPMVNRLTATIGGQPVASTDKIEIVDPATGNTFACAPACTRELQVLHRARR